MNKHEIGANAGKIWQLLSNNTKWDFNSLSQESGLSNIDLAAAIGWLARENKIDFDTSDPDNIQVFLYVNVFFG